jgi:hypothetical protein
MGEGGGCLVIMHKVNILFVAVFLKSEVVGWGHMQSVLTLGRETLIYIFLFY